MFFWKKDRLSIENLSKQVQILSNQIEMYEGCRNTNILKSTEKVEDNLKRINEMTLELKGVVSAARAALSERKAFDDFLELANKKILELVEASDKKNSKKIDKELRDVKNMIENLITNIEDLTTDAEPYAKITAILNTLERIEGSLEKQKKLPIRSKRITKVKEPV